MATMSTVSWAHCFTQAHKQALGVSKLHAGTVLDQKEDINHETIPFSKKRAHFAGFWASGLRFCLMGFNVGGFVFRLLGLRFVVGALLLD